MVTKNLTLFIEEVDENSQSGPLYTSTPIPFSSRSSSPISLSNSLDLSNIIEETQVNDLIPTNEIPYYLIPTNEYLTKLKFNRSQKNNIRKVVLELILKIRSLDKINIEDQNMDSFDDNLSKIINSYFSQIDKIIRYV